ncbi:hypothetical protein TRFO_32756 [Tritrichomonas foetus]|uniref:Uncharacterized protein n=1 Tax=Tritrichomonas foetus TaxID=1144522 RepID=A0A1J4JP57_9EUKA|nr:hypothetical protein TRFO_32756 [Tritrichomonas foetus]|eukprot:OHT00522.1 hypothetical protein TRFO_32756 [Tritrichomonas foetus]
MRNFSKNKKNPINMFSDYDPPSNIPQIPNPSDNWYTPSHQSNSKQLFKEPRKVFDYSDVSGSSPRASINTSVPARNNDKVAIETLQKRKLFEQPRDINKLVNEKTYSDKYLNRPIENNREPSPVKKRCFQGAPRENTKSFDASVPQIDLSRPVRKQVGCQSPIQSGRRQLFLNPRDLNYDDVEGSHPRVTYDGSKQPRDTSIYTIPNQPRLFNQPREIMKYNDVQGSHAKNQIDLTHPQRDLFVVLDKNDKKLFQEPRDWTKLPSQKRARSFPARKPVDEPEQPHRQLFKEPRETMNKYMDVDGSRPTQFYPSSPRKPSPTFASHNIF